MSTLRDIKRSLSTIPAVLTNIENSCRVINATLNSVSDSNVQNVVSPARSFMNSYASNVSMVRQLKGNIDGGLEIIMRKYSLDLQEFIDEYAHVNSECSMMIGDAEDIHYLYELSAGMEFFLEWDYHVNDLRSDYGGLFDNLISQCSSIRTQASYWSSELMSVN